MKPFCEVVVASVLPAVRSIITKELLGTYGLTQRQAADLLGLTQPAISQYNREARGFKVKLLQKRPRIMTSIDELAKDIASEKLTPKEVQAQFCQICKHIRESKLICHLHEQAYPGIAPCTECLKQQKT